MLNPDFRDMLSALSEEGVEFLLVGAYAMAVHGVPRATGDLDIWIRAAAPNVERLLRALSRFGAPLEGVSAADFVQPDLVFKIGVAPRRLDFLTSIDGLDFETAWRKRDVVPVDGLEVPVVALDDLIANKKAVGRPRDLADVDELEALRGR